MTDLKDLSHRLDGIGGWLTLDEAQALERMATGKELVMEIGSYMGRSAVAMAPVCDKLICIDHFHAKGNGQVYADDGSTFAEFNENTRHWRDKIEAHQMMSEEARKMDWPELDLLFIDGGHDFETCLGDISLTKWVKDGGLVVFHDKSFTGVKAAIEQKMTKGWKRLRHMESGALAVFEKVVGHDEFGRICIAIPHERWVYGEFQADLIALNSEGMRVGDMIMYVNNMVTHRARNELVRTFLRLCKQMEADGVEPYDSLCFIDSDMRFTKDALERLRSNTGNDRYDIIQAFYTTKGWPPYPVMMQAVKKAPGPKTINGWQFQWIHNWKVGDLVECDGVGGGFTIIRRKVFEKMLETWESLDEACFFEYRGDCTEDLWFCKNARELDFKIAVDTRVPIRHIGHSYVGLDDYLRWREGVRVGLYDEEGKKIPPAVGE